MRSHPEMAITLSGLKLGGLGFPESTGHMDGIESLATEPGVWCRDVAPDRGRAGDDGEGPRPEGARPTTPRTGGGGVVRVDGGKGQCTFGVKEKR